MSKLIGLLLFIFISNTFGLEIFSLKEQKKITFDSFSTKINSDALILMGESHYQKDSISVQSQTIKRVAKSVSHTSVQVAWEFLDFRDQKMIERDFENFKTNQISLSTLLAKYFPPSGDNTNPNHLYRKLFEAAKEVKGDFLGTNAPRVWKRIVVKDGVDALESFQIPLMMRRGSDEYFDRFFEAVGGHGDPGAIEGYFMAQSYTDAYMAQSLVDQTLGKLTFMTVGYFHNDYGHGLPSYLKDLTTRQIINIRLVDKSETSKSDLAKLKAKGRYGFVSDYLIFF